MGLGGLWPVDVAIVSSPALQVGVLAAVGLMGLWLVIVAIVIMLRVRR